MKIIGEPGEPLSGHAYEFFSNIKPVRGNVYPPFPSPTHQAIQQVAIGASDVQKAAAGLYGIEDRASFGAPALRAAVEPRLLDGIVRLKIRGFESAKLLLVVGGKFSAEAHGWDPE